MSPGNGSAWLVKVSGRNETHGRKLRKRQLRCAGVNAVISRTEVGDTKTIAFQLPRDGVGEGRGTRIRSINVVANNDGKNNINDRISTIIIFFNFRASSETFRS